MSTLHFVPNPDNAASNVRGIGERSLVLETLLALRMEE